jgi:hypothetical protein
MDNKGSSIHELNIRNIYPYLTKKDALDFFIK